MKKLISCLLAGLLLFPEFLLAEEKVAPPVPSSGNVTLSLDEYNRLLELASKPTRRRNAYRGARGTGGISRNA